MAYNIDFELTTDISQLTTFIPRTQILNLRLKTNSQNIQNIRIVLNRKEYYMLKTERDTYSIQLYKNTAIEGKNKIFFIIEQRSGKELTTKEFELDFYKANIVQAEYDEISFLISTISKMINKL